MARIRTIKPEFFTSSDIVTLPALARILYIGLWCEADKEGRLTWNTATFKFRYLPADDCEIDALCDALVTRGLIVLYGDGLAFIPRFKDHQHINPRESDSRLPDPDSENQRVAESKERVSDASIPDMHAQVGREGKGREGKTRSAFDADAIELPPLINKTSWHEWVKFRRSKKKPISEMASKIQIEMLTGYDQATQARIIEKSIKCDYQGLFDPDSDHRAQAQSQPARRLTEL